MNKFRNQYRIPSARLKDWDYRWSAAYFVTICTKHKMPSFGHIAEGQMNYSPIGAVADVLWYELKNRLHYVDLGVYVVMPNHMHGILIHKGLPQEIQSMPRANVHYSRKSPEAGSVSCIVRSYKSAVSRHVRRLGFKFDWQERFHDHIIRDQKSYDTISEYIFNNPRNWKHDGFYRS